MDISRYVNFVFFFPELIKHLLCEALGRSAGWEEDTPMASPSAPMDSPAPEAACSAQADRTRTQLIHPEFSGPGQDLAREWSTSADCGPVIWPHVEEEAGCWESHSVSQDVTLGSTKRNPGREPGTSTALCERCRLSAVVTEQPSQQKQG